MSVNDGEGRIVASPDRRASPTIRRGVCSYFFESSPSFDAAKRRSGWLRKLMTMRLDVSSVRSGSRVVLDPATGTQWVVVEIKDAPYDRRGGKSLVFSTDGVMRRIRDYPGDWLTLSDEELVRLSSHR